MRKSLYIYLLIISVSASAYSQNQVNLDSLSYKLKNDKGKLNAGKNQVDKKYKINYLKFGIVAGVSIGAGVWLHNYQKNSWWAGQRGKFHFQNDWGYSLSADKTGHFFDGALIQAIYQGAFEWSGFSPRASAWLGAAFSIAYMTDIEIEDGFARDWGFSPGDEGANILGALYPVAQHYWKPLGEYNIKWSYYPSYELLHDGKNGAFLDDYNGQTMWLSIGIHQFLPKKAEKYWPDFLNFCIGYGVDNYQKYDIRSQNYYIGLDLDYRKLIPGDSKFMVWFKNILNHFKVIPMPAIRFRTNGPPQYTVNF